MNNNPSIQDKIDKALEKAREMSNKGDQFRE